MLLIASLLFAACSTATEEKPANRANPSSASPSSAEAASSPLQGSATQKDKSGDVKDGDGRRPRERLTEIDLVEVKLEYVGSDLQITYVAAGDLPRSYSEPNSAIWTVTACSPDGNECAVFEVRLIGEQWSADWWPVSNTKIHKVNSPTAGNERIISKYPLDQLPSFIKKPFKWRASSERSTDKRYNDHVPDNDEKFVGFPAK